MHFGGQKWWPTQWGEKAIFLEIGDQKRIQNYFLYAHFFERNNSHTRQHANTDRRSRQILPRKAANDYQPAEVTDGITVARPRASMLKRRDLTVSRRSSAKGSQPAGDRLRTLAMLTLMFELSLHPRSRWGRSQPRVGLGLFPRPPPPPILILGFELSQYLRSRRDRSQPGTGDHPMRPGQSNMCGDGEVFFFLTPQTNLIKQGTNRTQQPATGDHLSGLIRHRRWAESAKVGTPHKKIPDKISDRNVSTSVCQPQAPLILGPGQSIAWRWESFHLAFKIACVITGAISTN